MKQILPLLDRSAPTPLYEQLYKYLKSAVRSGELRNGEKLFAVIALGYGENQGVQHRSKKAADVCEYDGEQPEWFRLGIEAALKAPTAVNQQKFAFSLENGEPVVRVKGLGSCTQTDLGIVACHFELASGRKVQLKLR